MECCNIGEGGWRSERELALLPCPSLSPLCPWRLPATLGSPQLPSPPAKPVSVSRCLSELPGPGPVFPATPPALAMVVASSC